MLEKATLLKGCCCICACYSAQHPQFLSLFLVPKQIKANGCIFANNVFNGSRKISPYRPPHFVNGYALGGVAVCFQPPITVWRPPGIKYQVCGSFKLGVMPGSGSSVRLRMARTLEVICGEGKDVAGR